MSKLLAAADLEMRIRVEEYDDHDDVLDARLARLDDTHRASRSGTESRVDTALRTARAV